VDIYYLRISPHFAVETTASVCENRIYGTPAREKSGLIVKNDIIRATIKTALQIDAAVFFL
jgi:hypothetical protein